MKYTEAYIEEQLAKIERIKGLILYMSTCPNEDADDCRLHATWIQEALDGGYDE